MPLEEHRAVTGPQQPADPPEAGDPGPELTEEQLARLADLIKDWED